MRLRPPMPYVGGKQSMADQIVALMAPHDHYVEPYFGGGSILMSKTPSSMETVNDIDEHLVTFWRMLRDRPRELAWACAMTPHSRAEHRSAQILTDCEDLETARRVWVQLTQGRGGRRIRRGRVGHDVAPPRPGDVITTYDSPSACLYVDPPYLGTARNRSGLYVHEMPDAADHARLLDTLLGCRGQVILSGYASPLYDEALSGWERIEVAARDQASRDRVEVLWVNRMPQPSLIEGEL